MITDRSHLRAFRVTSLQSIIKERSNISNTSQLRMEEINFPWRKYLQIWPRIPNNKKWNCSKTKSQIEPICQALSRGPIANIKIQIGKKTKNIPKMWIFEILKNNITQFSHITRCRSTSGSYPKLLKVNKTHKIVKNGAKS